MNARAVAQKVRDTGALYHRKLIGEYKGQAYYKPTDTGWQVCAAVLLDRNNYDLSGWIDSVFNTAISKAEIVYKL